MANLSPQALSPPCEIVIGGERYWARYLGPEDADALVELHRAVFGGSFCQQWYQWKYHNGQNPSLGLWTHTGQLIAHCGGVKRELFLKDNPVHGLQITDVMVHPLWRGILSRRGPFYWVSHLLYNNQIGKGRSAQVGYGFPSQRHLQLAIKLHLLLDGGNIWQMNWPSVSLPKTWFWHYDILHASEPRWSHAIEHAWCKMQAQSSHLYLGNRNSSVLQWRYAQHPEHQYFYLRLKRPWSSITQGVAIVREYPTANEGLLWVDWIGPPGLLTDALSMVRQYANQKQYTGVAAWGSKAIRDALRESSQYTELPIAGIGIPIQSCEVNVGQSVSKKPWWWMAGDTDFL